MATDIVRAEQTIKDLVRSNWGAITGSLPETVNPKRFAQLVFNSVRKTPALAQATATSLIGSLLAASVMGLEVDTPLGEANLLPFRRTNKRTNESWVEAQLIIGYQGVLKLYRQHPMAGHAASGWVGEHDTFEYAYGLTPHLRHVPAFGERGKPVAYWASYTLKDGTSDFVVLTPREVAELRGKGLDEKRDVADPQHWMERKTALKQVLKMAPRSTQLAAALIADEQDVATISHVSGMESVATAISSIAPVEHIDHVTGEVTDLPDSDDDSDLTLVREALTAHGVETKAQQATYVSKMLGREIVGLVQLTPDERVEVLARLAQDSSPKQ